MISLKTYFEGVETRHKTHPQERFPQAAFNHLYEVRSDLSEQVRGTDKDPFYCQDKTFQNDPQWTRFVDFIKENW